LNCNRGFQFSQRRCGFLAAFVAWHGGDPQDERRAVALAERTRRIAPCRSFIRGDAVAPVFLLAASAVHDPVITCKCPRWRTQSIQTEPRRIGVRQVCQASQIGHIEEGLHRMFAGCVPLGKCADAELV